MLDPKFKKVEQSYAKLRKQFDAGKLDGPRLEAAVRDLMIQHDGRHWMMGATSAKWYVGDAHGWTEATPPSAPAASPKPVPAPATAGPRPRLRPRQRSLPGMRAGAA